MKCEDCRYYNYDEGGCDYPDMPPCDEIEHEQTPSQQGGGGATMRPRPLQLTIER